MDKNALHLLDQINEIRSLAGLDKLNENSRRDFLKKAAAMGGAAAMGSLPGVSSGNFSSDASTPEEEVFTKLAMVRLNLESLWRMAKQGKTYDNEKLVKIMERLSIEISDAENTLVQIFNQ